MRKASRGDCKIANHAPEKPVLSIIVTAHNEGLLAHKTMLSLFEAAKYLDEHSITYEFIVSIDNGDASTLTYFRGITTPKNITLLEVSFKDLSASRNNAARQAKGDFITFIDADDLVSSNWIITAFDIVKTDPSVIIHPEYSITFGDDNLIWKKRDSGDKTLDTIVLIDNNLWDSPCLAHRSIFLNNPYFPNGNGFGYEDKKFNSDTLSSGIRHIVAPETILFVRRKIEGSMLRGSLSSKATLAPTKLLSYDTLRSLDISTLLDSTAPGADPTIARKILTRAKRASKSIASRIHSKGKRFKLYNNIVQPLREARQSKVLELLKETYPTWMIESWKQLHKIDNSIFPSIELLKSIHWYDSENIKPGLQYVELLKSFSQKPDTLFFVPHLIKGGADLLFINYANELKSTKGWTIAALQTEAKQSVWADKLSPDIDFVNLYSTFSGLDWETQQRLLATLVTQNGIKRIIIGNSQLAYDFVANHSTLLQRLDVAIYCFAFGEEFDEEGRLWGHIHTGIPKVYPLLTKIITDNKNTVNKLASEYAFDAGRFAVHYQPTAAPVRPSIMNTDKPLRILWASRVCKQKRPDIIKRISSQLNTDNYAIDVWGQLEEGLTKDYFKDSSVTYKGPFNGMDSLPTSEYDMYIYTSEGDGVPNVLQEVTAAGLPIIASNVGGIREFIKTNETGYLVEDHEDIAEYVKAVHLFEDSDLRVRMNRNAQKLLSKQFSKDTWRESIKKDFSR